MHSGRPTYLPVSKRLLMGRHFESTVLIVKARTFSHEHKTAAFVVSACNHNVRGANPECPL